MTQYNKVIGHGRAVPSAEEEFDAQTDDEYAGDVVGGDNGDGGGGGSDVGGELSFEDEGYRFGEGYRLAMADARDFSAGQEEQDEEEVDEFKEPSGGNAAAGAAEDDDDSSEAYSQAYVQY